MTPTYRDAGPADLPAIDRLFRASFAATFGHLYAPADLASFFARFTPETWAERLATHRFHLADVDGEPVGYAQLGAVTMPAEHAPGDRELRQLYLAEEAKGTGIADALIRWTIATARRQGAGTLFLSVYVDNARAIRFYARYGFTDIGAYAFMVGDHEDEDRIMRLVL